MDKIRLDFFDILGYLIPGTALLLALWITADSSVRSPADLYLFASKIDSKILLSGVVVSYVLGFTLHFFGSAIYRFLPGAPRKIRAEDLPRFWAQLRQRGEKHLVILDRWQALKALSSNLCAFSLIAVVLCLLKWQSTGMAAWAWIAPVFALLSAIYANRARVFQTYLDDDLLAVLEETKPLPKA